MSTVSHQELQRRHGQQRGPAPVPELLPGAGQGGAGGGRGVAAQCPGGGGGRGAGQEPERAHREATREPAQVYPAQVMLTSAVQLTLQVIRVKLLSK